MTVCHGEKQMNITPSRKLEQQVLIFGFHLNVLKKFKLPACSVDLVHLFLLTVRREQVSAAVTTSSKSHT